jgi:acetyl-CoA synthetase
VLEWNPPFAKWFSDGTLNLADNCLDRHVAGGRADKPAIIWEGEPGEVRKLSYRELLAEVSRCANALEGLGIVAGDRVGIYMGMVPEAAIAMLACARIGAIHSVIFGGFAAEAVRDRMNDASAKCIITQDGAWRRGSVVPLKVQVDKALEACPSVKHVIVLQRTQTPIELKAARPFVERAGRQGQPRTHCAAIGCGAPAVHPVHLGHHRQAQGRHAHDRGLLARNVPDDQVCVRSARR